MAFHEPNKAKNTVNTMANPTLFLAGSIVQLIEVPEQTVTTTPDFDDAANQEEQLEKIITQKWIACWPEGMEAWTEQRRTGYPKLFKVQTNNSNGTIDTDIMIRRLPFSQDDAKKDPEQYKNLCTALGGADNGGTRLWWDTGKNNF